jgi:acetoin utilization deacetylase AcuC-like enzyme
MTSTPREFRAWKAVICLADAHRGKEKVREPFHNSPYSAGPRNVKLIEWLSAIGRRLSARPGASGREPPAAGRQLIWTSSITLLYAHRRFLDHDTGRHPESAVRLEHVTRLLDSSGRAERCVRPDWQPACDLELLSVHGGDYLNALADFASRGGGRMDADTVVSPASFDVARLAAGSVCDAVRRVVAGNDLTALCLVRPPGHHALADRAMGFCLLGNVAIAARLAIDELRLDRVMIVDWDVHHGNGTQDMFYDEGRVGFFSTHRWPFWPGTGAADETGRGDGLGATKNLSIEFGTPRREYLTRFADELHTFAVKMKPQLVLISAGFDAHAADPIGSLGLETEDFAELTHIVQTVADDHAAGRIVSVLEGGYNPPVLAECVAVHLEGLRS